MVLLSEALPNQSKMEMLDLETNAAIGKAKPHALTPNSQLRNNAKEKRQLLAALSKVCALQKQYGKSATDLETLVEGFLWVLGNYPMNEILLGIAEYVKRNSDIPAPADIVKIIDPPKQEWKPDWAVYITLKKRIQQDGYYPYSDEREFLKRCDAYAVNRALSDDAGEEEKTGRVIASGQKTFALEGPDA
jgi:hypothetical protein